MAQIPEFISGQKGMGGLLSSLADARAKGRHERATRLAGYDKTGPLVGARSKKAGLALGERKLVQGAADWLVVAGGALLILAQSERNYHAGAMALSIAIITALWFFFADAFSAYKARVIQNRFNSSYAATKVLLVTTLAYTLTAWFAGGLLPIIRPRISETLAALLLIAPLLIVRAFVSTFLGRAPLRRRVVVVGANTTGYEMVEALRRHDGMTYEFLGFFDDEPALETVGNLSPRPSVRPTSDLSRVNDEIGIDQIVMANPLQTGPLMHSLSLCHERGVQITPMFALYQDLTGRVPVSHLGDSSYVALHANVKSTARTYSVVKRGLDILMALLVLVLTAPVMPLVALAIKLDSPGPVFFRQTRVGRGGRPFRIVKFRSMRANAEAMTGAVWAYDGDKRITRVGRFLRKSRLDELPQLWNVFVGDMSFVGPRPERPEFDEELEREIPFYRARRAVRPGLTGWAQVNYGYGSTLLDALRKVEYDLYYIKNESLYLDLLILLRTVAVVLKLGGT